MWVALTSVKPGRPCLQVKFGRSTFGNVLSRGGGTVLGTHRHDDLVTQHGSSISLDEVVWPSRVSQLRSWLTMR
jgi:hypothetical protein